MNRVEYTNPCSLKTEGLASTNGRGSSDMTTFATAKSYDLNISH